MPQREAIESTLADLHIEKARVDGERKAVEADLGPVRYLATLLGSTDEATMRGFILVVALLLYPLPSCSSRRRQEGGAMSNPSSGIAAGSNKKAQIFKARREKGGIVRVENLQT